MIYELIATDIDVKSCEAKCENKGGILPQDFGMLTVDDIYISGTTIFYRNEVVRLKLVSLRQADPFKTGHTALFKMTCMLPWIK